MKTRGKQLNAPWRNAPPPWRKPPCSVCGAKDPSFAKAVGLRHNGQRTWYCFKCAPPEFKPGVEHE